MATNSTSFWSELNIVMEDPKNFYGIVMSRSGKAIVMHIQLYNN